MNAQPQAIVRHMADAPREQSTCGWRYRLLSREDADLAAWAHVVDLDGSQTHFHREAAELYYVLEGDGVITLDGTDHAIGPGSIVHIPAGVVHSASGRMKVLVVGIPDIREDDLFFPEP